RVRAHQLVAPIPVDNTLNPRPDCRRRTTERVPQVVALLAYVDHRHTVNRPGVVRLPATGRVERGLVERDARIVDRGHRRGELAQIRVAQIQEFRQRLMRSSLNGVSRAGPGSLGSPRTRSPMMFRCTWSVPP